MKKSIRGSESDVTLKLDISKAYDRVDWGNLKERMQVMRIFSQWVIWMMLCVTT